MLLWYSDKIELNWKNMICDERMVLGYEKKYFWKNIFE